MTGTPKNNMIEGLSISGFRSFGNDFECIGPFGQINLLIGQNNSGKSNLLRFLWQHWPNLIRGKTSSLAISDFFGRTRNNYVGVDLLFSIRGDRLDEVSTKNKVPAPLRELVFNHQFMTRLDGNYYAYRVDLHIDTPDEPKSKDALVRRLALKSHFLNDRRFEQCHGFVDKHVSTRDPIERVAWLINTLRPTFNDDEKSPSVYFLNQDRAIGTDKDEYDLNPRASDRWNGAICIDQLARLQNPGGEVTAADIIRKRRQAFDDFVDFVRDVIDSPKLEIQVNYDRTHLLFDLNRGVIPHESLGAGLHHVVMIAAATTLFPKSIWCLEEPELYLHPTWQKRLIERLATTQNQYFIATHSPTLIDMAQASIFHFEHDGVQTRCKNIANSQTLFETFVDVGLRPSDLLQANCVIWIEGPSDRIYIRDWLQRIDKDLKENVHYSMLPYGGSLRSYLSAEDDGDLSGDDDLIKICRIARRSVFVMDRDTSLDTTKRRIKEEYEQNENLGYVWTTDGRTIENYINPVVIADLVKQYLGKDTLLPDFDKHLEWNIADVRRIRRRGNFSGKPLDTCGGDDKVKLAIAFSQMSGELEALCISDLSQEILRLSSFIRKCSGLRNRPPEQLILEEAPLPSNE